MDARGQIRNHEDLTPAARAGEYKQGQARDGKGASQRGNYSEGAKDCLPNAVRETFKESGDAIPQTYPTPQCFDAECTMLVGKEYNGKNLHAEKLGQTLQRVHRVTGQLNPDWVEWLMGFPPHWTEIDEKAPIMSSCQELLNESPTEQTDSDVLEMQSCRRLPKSSLEE